MVYLSSQFAQNVTRSMNLRRVYLCRKAFLSIQNYYLHILAWQIFLLLKAKSNGKRQESDTNLLILARYWPIFSFEIVNLLILAPFGAVQLCFWFQMSQNEQIFAWKVWNWAQMTRFCCHFCLFLCFLLWKIKKICQAKMNELSFWMLTKAWPTS